MIDLKNIKRMKKQTSNFQELKQTQEKQSEPNK